MGAATRENFKLREDIDVPVNVVLDGYLLRGLTTGMFSFLSGSYYHAYLLAPFHTRFALLNNFRAAGSNAALLLEDYYQGLFRPRRHHTLN